jgi:hypothetical protein
MRNVLLFRLQFDAGAGRAVSGAAPAGEPLPTIPSQDVERTPRPFRDEQPHPPSNEPHDPADPEHIAAKREKADRGHHAILSALNRALTAMGCEDVEEIPSAVDLWATRPDGVRVLFEAKTISATNELSQTRGGFAQLIEYRPEYGAPQDELCLIVDRPLAVKRQKLLDSLGIAVLVRAGADFEAGNDLGSRLIEALTAPAALSPPTA